MLSLDPSGHGVMGLVFSPPVRATLRCEVGRPARPSP